MCQSISSLKYRDLLQADLDNIVDWSGIWKLLFNHSKTMKLSFESKACHFSTKYSVDNHEILEKETHRYLGVMVCSDLALLSDILLFLVRTACEVRSTSYGLKHASQWLSCTPF